MNTEEKAQAYDKVLEKSKEFYILCKKCGAKDTVDFLEDSFPELKESEDEKIRKEILQSIRDNMVVIHKDECIAWLEKQGKIVDYYEDRLDECACKYFNKGYKHALEKQGEQKPADTCDSSTINSKEFPAGEKRDFGYFSKPADNVEPKFHIGDCVVDNCGYVWKIEGILNQFYILEDIEGCESRPTIEWVNKNFHLWTINDAKDGDVLAYVTDEEDLWIMIYQSLYEPYVGHVHYHALLVNDNFSDKGTCCICIDDLKPATKEQRDTLFAKIKEAGYEWDAEKKELKKIEQKPACSDDKKLTDVNHEYFSELLENNDSEDINDYAYQVAYCMSHDWIEETATWDDVQKACKLGAKWQKKHDVSEEWNKEDEKMINRIRGIVKAHAFSQSAVDVNGDLCEKEYIEADNWLKSLKQKIGG